MYKNVDGIVFVVDSGDPSRFTESLEALKAVLEAPLLQNKPLMILCHKQDLDGAADEEAVKAALEVDKIIDRPVLMQSSQKDGLSLDFMNSLLEEIVKAKDEKKSSLE